MSILKDMGENITHFLGMAQLRWSWEVIVGLAILGLLCYFVFEARSWILRVILYLMLIVVVVTTASIMYVNMIGVDLF